jgi:hypothetical protein
LLLQHSRLKGTTFLVLPEFMRRFSVSQNSADRVNSIVDHLREMFFVPLRISEQWHFNAVINGAIELPLRSVVFMRSA